MKDVLFRVKRQLQEAQQECKEFEMNADDYPVTLFVGDVEAMVNVIEERKA